MTKFSVNKQHLQDALSMLDGIIKPYPTLDSHKNLLIQSRDGKLHLTGADLESSITTYCKYKGKEVKVALPYHPLMKVISVSDKWMDFKVEGVHCSIITGNSEFIVPTFKYQEYPMPIDLNEPKIEFQFQENFLVGLKKCVEFVTWDELRPAMTKICLDIKDSVVKLVATDAHTLIYEDFEIVEKSEKQLLVPAKDIKSLPIESGIFRANDNSFEIECTQFKKRGRLFNGKAYPEYDKVIPKPKDYVGKIGCDKNDLLDALEKIRVINNSNTNQVELDANGELIISSKEYWTKKKNVFIKIECSCSGDTESFNIDASKLKKVLRSIDGKVIHFNLTGRNKAIIVSSDGHKRLLMPSIKEHDE